jgi:HK97 family phage portal protein
MGILSWFGIEKRSASRSVDEVIAALDGGYFGVPMSGEPVNIATALRVSAVLACVKVIAEGVATPQLNVFRNTANGQRQLATNIPEFRMLNRRPNEFQTSYEFRKTMTMHAALCGSALAVKVKTPNRRVAELIPVEPGKFTIDTSVRYEPIFRCYDNHGVIGDFGADDVLHIPSLRWELIKGLDVLSLAREAVGLSIAAERSQATLHANGGRPAGVLTTPQKLSVEAMERLKAGWKQFTSSNRNGTAVLDSDVKYQPVTMSGVDQQALEQRRFQVEEICRAFGVMPIMVGQADKAATYASAEAMFSAHLIHTLAPWHELWRQRLDEYVLDGAGPLYVDFDTRYLTQGSMRDRAEWARSMIEMRIMTRNEVRDSFGLDAVDGGDEFWSPANIAGGGAAAVEPDADDEEDDEDDDAQL